MGPPWCPSNAGDTDLISGQETKLPHAKRCDPCPPQKKKNKNKTESPNIQTLDGGCMSVWAVLKPGVDGGGIHGPMGLWTGPGRGRLPKWCQW